MASAIEEQMTNSVTFSPDMTLLYLVDDGRAIPFALNKRNGVLVTVLRGQLTVVSAPEIDRDKEETGIPENARAVIPDPSPSTPAPKIPTYPQKLSLPVPGNQFNVIYNEGNQALIVMGATDIDGAIRDGRAPGTVVTIFPLKERIINIRRIGDRLELLTIRF